MRAALAVLGALLAGCAPPGRLVEVVVRGGEGAVALELAVTLQRAGQEGAERVPPQRLPRREELVRLQLPEALRAHITVQVLGLGGDGCALAEGQAEGELDEGPSPVLVVELQPAPGCTLRIARVGPDDGLVTSEPAGIGCGPLCEARFPRGTRLRLEARGGPSSLFVGWDGPCGGPGPCEVEIGGGTTELRATFGPREVCSTGGFCWESPLPQGNALFGVWGFSDQDVWAVGDAGTVLRYNGLAWTPVPSGANETIFSVWGAAPDDLFMLVVDGTLLRFDGTRIAPVAKEPRRGLNALWGIGATGAPAGRASPARPVSLWIGGLRQLHGYRWDGVALAPLPTAEPDGIEELYIQAIHGNRPDDLWAVGGTPDLRSGAVLHFDGAAWQVVHRTPRFLNGVWASPGGDVWCAGNGGTLLRWDGAEWSKVALETTTDLWRVFGVGVGDGRVVGANAVIYHLRKDGRAERQVAPTESFLTAVWGHRPEAYFAVGDLGTIVRWNGVAWVAAGAPRDQPVRTIAVSPAGEAWALGRLGTFLQRIDGRWIERARPLPTTWLAASSPAPGWLWMASQEGVLLRLHDQQPPVWEYVLIAGELRDVFAVSATEAWVAAVLGPTRSQLVRVRFPPEGGQQLEPFTFPFTISGVWVAGTQEIWSVGAVEVDGVRYGQVQRGSGGAVMTARLPYASELYSVWGSGPRDVWAVGQRGTGGVVLHYDGSTISLAQITFPVRRVWGSGPADVWAVGDRGLVYRIDEVEATPLDSGYGGPLTGISGAVDGSELLVVGSHGGILRRRLP